MASMRDWLNSSTSVKPKVVVVHCKAGKGRSGTVACSYLISEEGWAVKDALARFTERRMRSGFGNGVSIPSQLRWIGYVDWWSKNGKLYVEKQVEILEVHVWGLRDGVKVAIEGYVEEGKIIKTFHTFGNHERTVMGAGIDSKPRPTNEPDDPNEKAPHSYQTVTGILSTTESSTSVVLFRPNHTIILPTSDIKIDFERRNKATYGFTMVTSVAHVWFNAFFESQQAPNPSSRPIPPSSGFKSPLPNTKSSDSGVFSISWDDMDGIKGSARKGTRALDVVAIVWRTIPDPQDRTSKTIVEPAVGEPIPDVEPADWTKANQQNASMLGKDLGLRTESPSSANVSRASSMVNGQSPHDSNHGISAEAGTKSHEPVSQGKAQEPDHSSYPTISISEPSSFDNAAPVSIGGGSAIDLGLEKTKSPSPSPEMVRTGEKEKQADLVHGTKAASTGNLKTAEDHVPGQILKS